MQQNTCLYVTFLYVRSNLHSSVQVGKLGRLLPQILGLKYKASAWLPSAQVLTLTRRAARPCSHKRTAQIPLFAYLIQPTNVSPTPGHRDKEYIQEWLLTLFRQQLKAFSYTHQFDSFYIAPEARASVRITQLQGARAHSMFNSRKA